MSVGQTARSNVRLHQKVARLSELGDVIWCGTTGGSSDTYTLTPDPKMDFYSDGARFCAFANHTNTTTTPTANISGRGAKTIVTDDAGTAVAAGDIQDGKLVTLLYNAARDELILINRDFEAEIDDLFTLTPIYVGNAAGTLDNGEYFYTATTSEVSSISSGQVVAFSTDDQNAGLNDGAYLNINGEGDIPLLDATGQPLKGGELARVSLATINYAIRIGGNYYLLSDRMRSSLLNKTLTNTTAETLFFCGLVEAYIIITWFASGSTTTANTWSFVSRRSDGAMFVHNVFGTVVALSVGDSSTGRVDIARTSNGTTNVRVALIKIGW